MILSDVSIDRPVFAAMITAAIIVFGMVLYARLNVDMYPEVNYPIVSVSVTYAGAGPDTMSTQVSEPIEDALNSLSGVRSISSTSLEGLAQITLEFDLAVEVGSATQEVRDKIATIRWQLPAGADDPVVQKFDMGAMPILQMAVAGDVAQTDLLTYAENTLKPALERVGGVGQIEVIGGRKREMHVWLQPKSLIAYGLTVDDVVRALAVQNIELPGGRVTNSGQELVVRTTATANTIEEIGALVIQAQQNSVVRLGDVASIEDGFEEIRSSATVDGANAVVLVLRKQSDANTVKVAEEVLLAFPTLQKSAPAGIDLTILTDNSTSIKSSIDTVQFDLVLGGFLAIFIIFVFLRDPRATIISALALPTAVIGTFGFVQIMGFTLNMMTTMALSLSIGILIDDAIVVIENIVRRRTVFGESAKDAARNGTGEIGLAVFATTMSIVAVFVPVAFMDGVIGQFFFEFGLTVAFAVLLSLFVSFTLTPMLSSIFLTEHHEPKGVSKKIEEFLTAMENTYRRIIRIALGNRIITLTIAVVTLAGSLALVPLLGFEFVPVADSGQYQVAFELPPGTLLEETEERGAIIAERLREIPGVTSVFSTIGGGQGKVQAGTVTVKLVNKAERAFSQEEAIALTRNLLANEPNMKTMVSAEGGEGGGAALQINLLGTDLDALAAAANRTADRLRSTPGYVDVDTSFQGGKPELLINIDRARAANLGVTGSQIATTVRSLIAGEVATRVENHEERYDVRVQLPAASRELGQAQIEPQVRTNAGKLVEFTNFATFKMQESASQIDRLERQNVVTISANLDGLVLGEASDQAIAIAKEEAGPAVIVEAGGSAKSLNESMASMLLALFLAGICVYMILASQFESFIHPLTIMSSIPFALIGAFGGLLIAGMSMSIFGMIGLIMLMGLVTKNGILLVDFAVQRLGEGEGLNEALENAGAIRLRPILMTTAAMIFGMLPVAIGHGEGGELRAPMGVIIIGGLISSTVLTLIVLPVIYNLVELARLKVVHRFMSKNPSTT